MAVIVVGRYSAEHSETIEAAIARAGVSPTLIQDPAQARADLSAATASVPQCIFVHGGIPDLGGFVAALRGQPRLFSVPIFATVEQVADRPFADAFAQGVDAVVAARDMGSLTRHAASVAGLDMTARPSTSQGVAVIADSQLPTRQRYGRILRQAGFEPVFAGGVTELMGAIAREPRPRVIVLAHDFDSDVSRLVSEARSESGLALLPSVIVGDGPALAAMAPRARDLGAVAVLSSLTPPDSLLFVVNELLREEQLRGAGPEQRTSARLLYGTLCAFRAAGEIQPVFGFTYNVSREGLYVKTFEPPARGTELWLEMRPNDEHMGVHLRGRVMWSRRPDPAAAATTPPGFGLQIDGAACPPGDLARYRTAYDRLLADASAGAVTGR